MEKVKLMITAGVHSARCNLRCKYCYVPHDVHNNARPTPFKYSIEQMIEGLSKKRLGGIALISVVGNGETLLDDEIVPLVKGLLKEGHFVNLVTNMTLNNRINDLLETPKEDLKRLIVRGSLHYDELIRLNKLNDFFANMNKVIEAGGSSYPFLVACEDYVEKLDEINDACLNAIGERPQVSAELSFNSGTELVAKDYYTEEVVNKIKNTFNSKVFDVFNEFLDIKPQKAFCYAGLWSFHVDLASGVMKKCPGLPVESNIFEDLSQ